MRSVIVVAAVGMAVVLAGCSSNRKAIDELRGEQRRTQGQINQVSGDLNKLRQDINLLIRQTDEFSARISLLESRLDMVEGGTTVARNTTRETTPGGEDGTAGDEHVTPIKAETLEELAQEVARLRADLEQFRHQFVTAQEEEQLRDPQETWRAINDPEKMGWRLDRFAKVWAPKIEDEATRDTFSTDVAAVKQQIGELAQMPRDQAVAFYRAKLVERTQSETNDRMKRWFEAQVQMIDRAESTYIDNQLEMYRRYDTVLALKKLADKYQIAQDVMRDNGLPITGLAYGWE